MAELKRVFIAISVSDDVIKEVARMQEQLKKRLQFVGKLTELENLHLTLKFLGDVDEETLEKVKEKLKTLRFEPLKLKLGHVGAFNYKNMPRIIWIKILGDVAKVQKQVDESLKDLFKPEERFMSHLTLARIKHVGDLKYAQDYIKHLKLPPIAWIENKIQLKESILKIDGPVYVNLEEYSSQG